MNRNIIIVMLLAASVYYSGVGYGISVGYKLYQQKADKFCGELIHNIVEATCPEVYENLVEEYSESSIEKEHRIAKEYLERKLEQAQDVLEQLNKDLQEAVKQEEGKVAI